MAIFVLKEAILGESKRDDLLLPYLEITNSKGFNLSLGEFKQKIHKILVNYGGFHNLSLESNYYLAGVTRYYFEGQLTTNKDLSIFKENIEQNRDNWITEICTRLDALIAVLRNAYIDTIGTQFEQPEDFGTLSLPKLLRKYNKKIDAELSNSGNIDTGEENNVEKTDLNSGSIGTNGYTYAIMYSQEDCRPYKSFTEPGAWCITYSQGNYEYYTQRMSKSHFVFFLKNGYQNIQRRVGEGFTNAKPHDEYGNSMIALLQSNENGEPVYITSRWNHGAGGPEGRVEADHAYTKDEFLNIVGITDADLQRIFNIWKENKKYHKDAYNDDTVHTISKEEKIRVIRTIKYCQMKIRGGTNPSELFNTTLLLYGNGKTAKSIFDCSISIGENTYQFLMDKGNIIFETLSFPGKGDSVGFYKSEDYYSSIRDLTFPQSVILVYETFFMIYDVRKHKLLEIGGKTKFKAIPKRRGYYVASGGFIFYEVRMGHEMISLVSLTTNEPLILPNGEPWIHSWYGASQSSGYRGRTVRASFVYQTPLIDITYDDSSHEGYFYSPITKKFIELENICEENEDYLTPYLNQSYDSVTNRYFIVKYTDGVRQSVKRFSACFDYNGKALTIGDTNKFTDAKIVNDDIVAVSYIDDYYEHNKYLAYVIDENRYLTINGENIMFYEPNHYNDKIIWFRKYGGNSGSYIYNNLKKAFFENPTGKPSKELFDLYGYDQEDETIEIRIMENYNVDYETIKISRLKLLPN